MKTRLLERLRCPACRSCDLALRVTEHVAGEGKEGRSACPRGRIFRVTNHVPRFVDYGSYVDNFSLEWSLHRRMQLDSANGGRESERRFAVSMDFPLADLRDKMALDVSCGTGRFAEVVLKYGGTAVGVDLSYAVDAAFANMGRDPEMHILQADIFDLPLQAAGRPDLQPRRPPPHP